MFEKAFKSQQVREVSWNVVELWLELAKHLLKTVNIKNFLLFLLNSPNEYKITTLFYLLLKWFSYRWFARYFCYQNLLTDKLYSMNKNRENFFFSFLKTFKNVWMLNGSINNLFFWCDNCGWTQLNSLVWFHLARLEFQLQIIQSSSRRKEIKKTFVKFLLAFL